MDYFQPNLDRTELNGISALGLAHMGDGVFELLVRSYLCSHGMARSGDLHRETVAHVSAPAQAEFVDAILPLLTEEEQAVYRRGRNAHVHAVPKNATPGQYAKATGLEALFGALFLTGQNERLHELFCAGMEARHAL